MNKNIRNQSILSVFTSQWIFIKQPSVTQWWMKNMI